MALLERLAQASYKSSSIVRKLAVMDPGGPAFLPAGWGTTLSHCGFLFSLLRLKRIFDAGWPLFFLALNTDDPISHNALKNNWPYLSLPSSDEDHFG